MEGKIIRAAAEGLAHKLNRYTNKEGLEFTKMVIGTEIMLINISKLFLVYLIAVLLGTLIPTLITHGAYILIKRFSFGLHALNTTVCTVVSCILFALAPWLLSHLLLVSMGNSLVLAVFPFMILALYLYAPADTKARPLVGKKLRTRLKWKAVVCGIILMAAALLVPNESAKFLMAMGAAFQVISILPITYKILKRSQHNYQQYENPA